MEETSGDDQDIEKIAERYRSTLDKDDSIEVLAEAHYRLGLYELIQQRNIEQATHHFSGKCGSQRPLLVSRSPDIALSRSAFIGKGRRRRRSSSFAALDSRKWSMSTVSMHAC